MIIRTPYPDVRAQIAQRFKTNGMTTDVVPAGATLAKIECVGAGGGATQTARGAGGGGAYSASTVSVVAGETLTIQVPAYTQPTPFGTVGTDCFAKRGATTLVLAKSADAAITSTSAVAGGQASGGVGTIRYSGGSCPDQGASGVGARAGGGGAAGPNGNGGNGSLCNPFGGGGGGGANGGGNGVAGTSSASGAGGAGPTGVAGGLGSAVSGTAGGNVVFGSGGGGGYSNQTDRAGKGGNNSHNAEWGGIYGLGSGGGGGSAGGGGLVISGGLGTAGFGGGAGGHLDTGNPTLAGGNGLIVITYT